MRQCAKVYFQSNGDTEWVEKSICKELKTQIALDAIKGHNKTAWVLCYRISKHKFQSFKVFEFTYFCDYLL